MSESGAQIQNLMDRRKKRALESLKAKKKMPKKKAPKTNKKKKSVISKIKKFRNKAMNTAADLMGATSAVKVGGNLVQNLARKKGEKVKQLYKKGDYKSLAKDVTGIATLGAASLGAVSGLAGGAKAKVIKGGSSYKPSITRASQRASQNKFLQKYGLSKMKYN